MRAGANDPRQRAYLPSMVHDLPAAAAPTAWPSVWVYSGVSSAPNTRRSRVRNRCWHAKQAFPAYPDAVLRHLPQTTNIFTDCGQWDVPAADPGLVQPVHTDVPTLLVRGPRPDHPAELGRRRGPDHPECHPVGVP